MKEKKSLKVDLKSKRVLFIEIGLIVVLALVYMAFELKSHKNINVGQFVRRDVPIDEDFIPIAQPEKIELPPPLPQPNLFQGVDNNIEIETDPDINVETNPTEIIPPVPWGGTKVPDINPDIDEPFFIVEQVPEYPGGDEARLIFLRSNIKYPQIARETGIHGTVYVSFVVEKDGALTQIKILRGIGGGCDEEAIRVTKMMPKWKPGKQREREVRVSYQMPIKFTLQD
jgi:protein TonB